MPTATDTTMIPVAGQVTPIQERSEEEQVRLRQIDIMDAMMYVMGEAVQDYGKDLSTYGLPSASSRILQTEAGQKIPAPLAMALQSLSSLPAFRASFSEMKELWHEYREGDGEALADFAMVGTYTLPWALSILGQASNDPKVVADSVEAADAAGIMAAFFNLAGGVEDKSGEKLEAAIEGWLDRLPEESDVVQGLDEAALAAMAEAGDLFGEEQQVPLESRERHDLEKDNIVILRAGDVVPANMVILHHAPGTTYNRSNTSGEFTAANARDGAPLYQGNQLLEGMVYAKVDKPAEKSAVEGLFNGLEEAEDPRRSAEIKKRVTHWVYGMLGITGLRTLHTVWTDAQKGKINVMEGKFGHAQRVALTTITAALPCAIMASLTEIELFMKALMPKGVFFKSPAAVESLGDTQRVVMDITGTGTTGIGEFDQFGVLEEGAVRAQGEDGDTDIFADDSKGAEIFRLVASLEKPLEHEHHMSRMLVGQAEAQGLRLAGEGDVKLHKQYMDSGKGVQGTVEGKQVLVGNAKLMREQGYYDAIPAEIREAAEAREYTGKSISFARIEHEDGRVEWAYMSSGDQVREGVREAIQAMQANGIEVWLCTGGPQGKAEWFAEKVGLENPEVGRNIFCEMGNGELDEIANLPSVDEYIADPSLINTKLDVVRLARSDGKQVLGIGDGFNDATMLTATRMTNLDLGNGKKASRGVTMVVDDVADQVTMDVGDILSKNGVAKLPYLINASKAVVTDVKRTSSVAMGYVGSLVSSNLFFGFLKKNPVFMAVFHELPTLLFTMFSAFRARQLAAGLDRELEEGVSQEKLFEVDTIIQGLGDAWDMAGKIRKQGLGQDSDGNIRLMPVQMDDAALSAA